MPLAKQHDLEISKFNLDGNGKLIHLPINGQSLIFYLLMWKKMFKKPHEGVDLVHLYSVTMNTKLHD